LFPIARRDRWKDLIINKLQSVSIKPKKKIQNKKLGTARKTGAFQPAPRGNFPVDTEKRSEFSVLRLRLNPRYRKRTFSATSTALIVIYQFPPTISIAILSWLKCFEITKFRNFRIVQYSMSSVKNTAITPTVSPSSIFRK